MSVNLTRSNLFFKLYPSTTVIFLRLSTTTLPIVGGTTRLGMQNISGRAAIQAFTLANAASIKTV
jgi:hypothetical protein